MNITPNSFSDGGTLKTQEDFNSRIKSFGKVEGLDIGAESTAPMNQSISWREEWERIKVYLPLILAQDNVLSFDTYHPETILELAEIWPKGRELIWNDVSGKFDEHAEKFLRLSESFKYVLCHNLVKDREDSGKHMESVFEGSREELFTSLVLHFKGHIHPRVIFDPTLGFSKNYEQNWFLLENFHELQKQVGHNQWLLGFSRKSFLREKFQTRENHLLDQHHISILNQLRPNLSGEVWIRTHRPELIE